MNGSSVFFPTALLLLLLLLPQPALGFTPCDPCKPSTDSTWLDSSVPTRHIDLTKTCPNFSNRTTQILPDVDEKDPYCQEVKSMATMCGVCPRPFNYCTLCSNKHDTVTFPDLRLPASFSHPLRNQIPTCAEYNQFLGTFHDIDPYCKISQQFLQHYCGCSSLPAFKEEETCSTCPRGDSILHPTKEIRIPGMPFETCAELDSAVTTLLPKHGEYCEFVQSFSGLCGCPSTESKCSLCKDGSGVFTKPSKLVPFMKDLFQGVVPTCEMVQAYAQNYEKESDHCLEMQQYGTYCGCPPVEDHCNFGCELDSELGSTQVEGLFPSIEGLLITCDALFASQFQAHRDDKQCEFGKFNAEQCGCGAAAVVRQSALSQHQQKTMVWIPRIFGIISSLVSLLILGEIMSTRMRRTNTFYQLILLIALFDFISGVVWAVGPLSVPEFDANGRPTNVYGANGNVGTCRAQGFFRQLGQTSVFLMLSLSVFYFLALIYRWKEHHLQPARMYFFGIPLLLGIGLAVGAAFNVTHFPFGCQVNVDPRDGNLASLLVFVTVPIYITTQAILILLGVTLCLSPRQSRRFITRRLPNAMGVKDQLEAEVVWQNIWFTLSYLITWPVWGVGMFYDPYESYGVWLLVVILTPMGGITNGCVYFWPRLFDRPEQQPPARAQRNLHDRQIFDGNFSSSGQDSKWKRNARKCRWRIVKAMKNTARACGELCGRKKNWETRPSTYAKDSVIDEDDAVLSTDSSFIKEDPFEDITGLLRPVV